MSEGPNIAGSRWVRVALGLAVAGSAAILWSAFCTVPSFYWNPPRLAPAFALAEGLDIYATRETAGHLGWHYGPVFPIFSLPATLAGNITVAFWIWGGLNLLAICGPAWLVLREMLGAARAAWMGLAFYLVLLLSNWITLSMVFAIHIDALCVGWGTLAAWCVHRAAREPGRERFLHGAALGVALAIFTKQIAVLLVPALLAWLWWQDRRAPAGRLLLWLVVYAGGLAVVFFLWFGGEQLVFNLWLIHARTPRWGGLAKAAYETASLFWIGWVWLVTAALALVVYRPASTKKENPPGLENLLLWVAAFHLPFGLWAVTKVGGGLNSMHSLNYFLPVAAVWLMRIAHRRPEAGGRWGLPPGVAVFLVTVFALGSAYHCTLEFQAQWRPYRGQEQMLQIARANAGRMYFPWNPLLTVISDKKVYPFDNALFCLFIADLEPPTEIIRTAVPARPVIIYHEPVQGHFALKYFPEHGAKEAPPQKTSP